MIIMLFGITNVGKTVTGQLLAEKLKYTFYDLDAEIRKHYHTTLEQMNRDYPDDKKRHKLKGDVLRLLVNEHPCNSIIAVPPLYHTENFEDIIKQKNVIAIELKDSPENIFERMVFSDENDVLYTDNEYKEKHKDYYLNDIFEDILFYSDVFKNIKIKYFMDNQSPKEVVNELVKIIDLHVNN